MKLDDAAIEAAYERAVEVLSHDVCSKEDFYSIIVAYEAARLGLRYSEECEEIVASSEGDKLYINGSSITTPGGLWNITGLMAFGKVRGQGKSREQAIAAAIAHGAQLERDWYSEQRDWVKTNA